MRLRITMDVDCDNPKAIYPHALGKDIAIHLTEWGAGLETWTPPVISEHDDTDPGAAATDDTANPA